MAVTDIMESTTHPMSNTSVDGTTQEPEEDKINVLLIAIIAVFSAGFLVMLICGFAFCKKKRRRQREGQPRAELPPPNLKAIDNAYLMTPVPLPEERSRVRGYANVGMQQSTDTLGMRVPDVLQKALIATVEQYILDPRRLTLGETLGQGRYGKVYEGKLLDKEMRNPKTVAVKAVRDETCTEKDAEELIREAIRMRGFQHPNVINTLGLVFDHNRPLVIMPFMKNGDLREFVSDAKRTFQVRTLLTFGVQAADGMAYLAQQNFIHRDLAARNCMVDEKENLQISDFGLAHDIFDEDYYRLDWSAKPLPVRWMAVECLTDHVYTKESDVWSYGILLWEIFTRGKLPYVGMSNEQVVRYVKKGSVLKKPHFVAEPVYQVMMRCWQKDPTTRPTFIDLASELKEVLSDDRARKASNPAVPSHGNADYYNSNTNPRANAKYEVKNEKEYKK